MHSEVQCVFPSGKWFNRQPSGLKAKAPMWKHRDFLVKALISSYLNEFTVNLGCVFIGLFIYVKIGRREYIFNTTLGVFFLFNDSLNQPSDQRFQVWSFRLSQNPSAPEYDREKSQIEVLLPGRVRGVFSFLQDLTRGYNYRVRYPCFS